MCLTRFSIQVSSFSSDLAKPIGIEIPPGLLVGWDWIVNSSRSSFILQALASILYFPKIIKFERITFIAVSFCSCVNESSFSIHLIMLLIIPITLGLFNSHMSDCWQIALIVSIDINGLLK